MTKVLLYSGGLDSYMAAHLWQPDVLLHVDMGTGYGRVEASHLTVPPTVHAPLLEAHLDLSGWERPDAIIPMRNLFLVTAATNYGETVALAATAGDRVLDKSVEFADQATSLLRYLWQPQHWTVGKDITVTLPYKSSTKRELVREYRETGGDVAALAADTFSCYTPTLAGGHCGTCKPCARKWVALCAEGVDPGYDAAATVLATYLPAIQDGTWDRGLKEAASVMDALRWKGLA